MNYVLKRIEAYLIDIILVSIVAGLITSIPFINPYKEKYNEYSTKLNEITTNYSEGKIKKAEYKVQYIETSYKLEQYGVTYSVTNMILLIAYFIFFQYYNKGQTIGKKMFKLKTVNKGQEKVSLKNITIRSILINSIYVYILNIILVMFLNKNSYYNTSSVITTISNIVVYTSLLLILFSQDKRGLHDIIAGTEVISLEENVVDTNNENKVIDIEAEEKEVKKTTNKKKNVKKESNKKK